MGRLFHTPNLDNIQFGHLELRNCNSRNLGQTLMHIQTSSSTATPLAAFAAAITFSAISLGT
jgi:hypothetical protein